MSKRIMVVDDSRVVQMQLQKILTDTDYEIITCCQSGEEALSMYDQVLPDLVTMDILMPGMDGLETARMILKKHPDARIIMVSSLAYDDTVNEASTIGTKGFVYKPFDRDKLLLALEQAFVNA